MQKRKRASGARNKYSKIPMKTKAKFLKKILEENYSIRDVGPLLFQSAALFSINYSTAKTLIRLYKASVLHINFDLQDQESNEPYDYIPGMVRCSFRDIMPVEKCDYQTANVTGNNYLFYLPDNPVLKSSCSAQRNTPSCSACDLNFKRVQIISSIQTP